MRKRIRTLLLATAIAVAGIGVQSVLDDSHFGDAEAAWTTCHGTQNVHELSNPPASWPGTRAAHVVQQIGGGAPWWSYQYFYTKSGWWDPTWDYYKTVTYQCG